MIRSKLSGWGIHCDIVNPKMLELEAAKEILAELYGIEISEVDGLTRQCILDFRLMVLEFGLYISARRSHFS